VPWWTVEDGGLVVALRVVPNARRSEVAGVADSRLRVRIAAPAVDGKANAEVQRFVAQLFGVRRGAVTLRRGERSRDKSVYVAGASEPPVELRGD
jgi:uncharacterized protein (TIGR00251 family)